MDIISYGLASKIAKQEKDTRENVLATGVEGSHPHVRDRINKLEEGLQGVVEQADKLIVQDAVNIMKAHAKLNAIAKTTKYKMHNMIFDDLLDLSGIDTLKSSGYAHDAVEGTLAAGANCVVETKEEVTDAAPSKVILTVEEHTSVYSNDVTPKMTSKNSPSPYAVLSSNNASDTMSEWKAFDHDKTNKLNAWSTDSWTYAGWLQFDFGTGNEKAIEKYVITSLNHSSANTSSPKNWVFQGSLNGSTWVDLDLRSNITGWTAGQAKEFMFTNSVKFRYYRINIAAAQISNSGICIQEFEMMESMASDNSHKGDYSISRDSGKTWEPITPDTLFYFKDSISPLDNKLRLKAELPSGTKLLNYSLTWA